MGRIPDSQGASRAFPAGSRKNPTAVEPVCRPGFSMPSGPDRPLEGRQGQAEAAVSRRIPAGSSLRAETGPRCPDGSGSAPQRNPTHDDLVVRTGWGRAD